MSTIRGKMVESSPGRPKMPVIMVNLRSGDPKDPSSMVELGGPFIALLDTGANACSIDIKLIEKLNLKSLGKHEYSASANAGSADMYTIIFEILDEPDRNKNVFYAPATAFKYPDGVYFHCILGMNFIKHYKMTVSFGETVQLERSE